MNPTNDQILLQIREQEKQCIKGNNYHYWLLCAARDKPFFTGFVANYWADAVFPHVTEKGFKQGNFSRFSEGRQSIPIGGITDDLHCAEIRFTRHDKQNAIEIYFAGRLTRTITDFAEWKSYCRNWYLENSFAGDFWNAYSTLRTNLNDNPKMIAKVGDEAIIWDVTQNSNYGWGAPPQDFNTCPIWQVLSINGCFAECATLAPNGNTIKQTFYTCELCKLFSE